MDRRAAILAADMVGYSRLMEAVEAGTARLLREYRAVADAALTCRASLPRLAVPFPAAAD